MAQSPDKSTNLITAPLLLRECSDGGLGLVVALVGATADTAADGDADGCFSL